jgi:hypothetical protein
MDHPKFKNITKNDNPNNPNTIDGIEANVSAPNVLYWLISHYLHILPYK